jgi:hypothetical protein
MLTHVTTINPIRAVLVLLTLAVASSAESAYAKATADPVCIPQTANATIRNPGNPTQPQYQCVYTCTCANGLTSTYYSVGGDTTFPCYPPSEAYFNTVGWAMIDNCSPIPPHQ